MAICTRAWPWVGVVGSLVLVVACSAPTPANPGQDPSPGAQSASAEASPVRKSPAGKTSINFCKIDQPADWGEAEQDGRLPKQDGESIRVGAVSEDGEQVFSIIDVADSSTLVADQDGNRRKIFAVPDPQISQLGTVRFDGRWVVFEHLLGFDIDATWELYVWDSAKPKSEPQRIARRAKGSPSVGFFRFDVDEGHVTWMQPRTFEQRDIHLYDLEAAKDRVIKKKMIFGPMLSDDVLIWQEQGADEVVRLTGLELGTEQKAEIPEQVQAAGGSFDIVTDGTTWAWNSADFTKLYAWRDGWKTSATVRDDGQGNHFQYLALSGDLLTYTDDHATFAADLERHSYSPLTKSYGGAVATGDTIAVNSPADKGQGAGQTASVVDSAQLSRLPDCGNWTPVPER